MSQRRSPTWRPSACTLYAGVARCDVTPPVGIYARMWGAAEHDRAEGVHRPITATVLAMRQRRDATPMLLVSLDWVHLGVEEFATLRRPLLPLVDDDASRIIIACTHTHAAGLMSFERADQPGGEMIAPYIASTAERIAEVARLASAHSAEQRCTLTWAIGRCSLAANRDLPSPTEPRDLCGFNPDAPADDTLLVGRVTADRQQRVVATIVNYACHATTLGWGNRLLSPDYVGAMRQLVEAATDAAPCVFLQGASGELAPRHQYVDDPTVADAHGQQLGYAVLSALSSMLPPGQRLAFDRVVESGAPLAVWRPEADTPAQGLSAACFEVTLPLKATPEPERIEAQMQATTDRVLRERLRRKLKQARAINGRTTHAMTAWCWRLGDTLLLAQPAEAYSALQQQLRAHFADRIVAVVNVANGSCGYLYPESIAKRDSYCVWQSPFAPGGLETLISDARLALERLLSPP